MNLQWHINQSVGDKHVDLIHQMHFELINDLSAAIGVNASKERCLKQFEEFAQFVRFHSAAEENVMQETNFQELDKHRGAHAYGLEMIKSGIHKLRNDKISAKELLNDICDWYLMHISKEDKQFGNYLKLLISEFHTEFCDSTAETITGPQADEYIWQKFSASDPENHISCMQKHVIEFLVKRSPGFREKYSEQSRAWFDAHTEDNMGKDGTSEEFCDTCRMRPFCSDVDTRLTRFT